MSANHYDLELEQLGERATGRLLMADTFDKAAFGALYDYLAGKAGELREESVLSKQILTCLRQASGAIRSRSEYVPAAKDSVAVADKFEMLLDLLIAGEEPARGPLPELLQFEIVVICAHRRMLASMMPVSHPISVALPLGPR